MRRKRCGPGNPWQPGPQKLKWNTKHGVTAPCPEEVDC
jgi:hypothetical protein